MRSIHQTSGCSPAPLTQNLALDCYLTALSNVAHYAVEFDDATTEPHRRYVGALAADVKADPIGQLAESRGTLRGLLRDYRDKSAQYLSGLREQFGNTAKTLQETIEALSHSDGEHSLRIRDSLSRLREIGRSDAGTAVSSTINGVTDTIDDSLGQLRQEHQFTVSQLQSEIRILHNRVEALEKAAAIDEASKLSSRRSIQEYIRSLPPAAHVILLLRIRGLSQARSKHGAAIADDLIATFARRLRNSLPKEAAVGRWGEADFLAVLTAAKGGEAPFHSGSIASHLAMPYTCMLSGKVVRVSLQITVELLTTAPPESPASALDRVELSFAAS